ncbi:MAG TPA: hypothetical protein VKQ52_08830, partial [Puia sp.]|nr:hypothetical protein [Puia sp.]
MTIMSRHPVVPLFLVLLAVYASATTACAQPILSAGEHAQLEIRQAGAHSIRITLKPSTYAGDLPFSPALIDRPYPSPALVVKDLSAPVKKQVGGLVVEISPAPLTVTVTTRDGLPVQRLIFGDSALSFALDDAPVLGLGEGGHKPQPGVNWRTAPIEFDRRGRWQDMQPRWQSDAYGSRNPVPLLIGTKGWALFVATPWGQIDLQAAGDGVFIPWQPTPKDTIQQNEHNQGLAQAKGLPPAGSVVPGL